MPVIGRRAFVVLCCGACCWADDVGEVHKVIGSLADALSNGEATLAMSAFSKKCPDYDRLSGYFDALTGAYFVENRLEFPDQEISAAAASVAVKWELALTTRQGGFTRNRSAELMVKLERKGKHWRIVEFAPIGIFDPQAD